MDILALAALAPPRRKTVDFYGTRALDRSMPTSTSTRVEDVDVADVARADLGLERFPSSTTARGKDVADDGATARDYERWDARVIDIGEKCA